MGNGAIAPSDRRVRTGASPSASRFESKGFTLDELIAATAAYLHEHGLGGPVGPQGVQGIPGLAGQAFVHEQAEPSSEWIVNHGLGREPVVAVIEPDGEEVDAEIRHSDVNSLIVKIFPPTAGKAVCG